MSQYFHFAGLPLPQSPKTAKVSTSGLIPSRLTGASRSASHPKKTNRLTVIILSCDCPCEFLINHQSGWRSLCNKTNASHPRFACEDLFLARDFPTRKSPKFPAVSYLKMGIKHGHKMICGSIAQKDQAGFDRPDRSAAFMPLQWPFISGRGSGQCPNLECADMSALC